MRNTHMGINLEGSLAHKSVLSEVEGCQNQKNSVIYTQAEEEKVLRQE